MLQEQKQQISNNIKKLKINLVNIAIANELSDRQIIYLENLCNKLFSDIVEEFNLYELNKTIEQL